eukprot:XP_011662210.1 PREDICTED: uncharacterized protein LOC105437383 [Strongylocentrotus purpuratus]
MNELITEKKNLKDENEWLREMVQDTVPTKDSSGQYTNEMKQCVFALLNHNVPSGKIGPVIESVLKLGGLKASNIPSKSTVTDWNIMRLIIAQNQLAEELPSQSSLGLLSDETSKFGQKYEGYHVSDPEGRLRVLGLRDIVSKAGQDILDVLKVIFGDIEQSSEKADDTAKHILLKISCTMSDRASTQLKFNELLEDYRKEILPMTIDNYEHLSDAEKLSVGKLCNFFCGLHALVHLAETASSSMLETQQGFFSEAPAFDKSFQKASEPGTTRLIRTACKAVAHGGDEKSGCHGNFLAFIRPWLKEHGFRKLPIEPFHGNRFNILFRNAASVFYLHEELTTFLQSSADNKLLKAVLHDIQVPEYLAGCIALGLVAYLVTIPLWSSIEDEGIHIIDVGARYQEIIDFLVQASNNVQTFMEGTFQLSFANTYNHFPDNVIFSALVKAFDHDDKTEVILSNMLPAMAQLLKRIFSDHLDGGRWQDLKYETK